MEKAKHALTQTKKTKSSRKPRANKIKAKLLNSFYGQPIKDMKLICITGTSGKSTVAHFVHEILGAANQQVAILASDQEIKVSTLHKFFNTAWKAGANYVIVTTPAESLAKDVFYDLPVHLAAITNFIPASLNAPSTEEYISDEATLFKMNPNIVVLNQDDAHYSDFKIFAGTDATITYGSHHSVDVQVETSKLYKKGTEAQLNLHGTRFTVASFLTGEPVVSYMAAATAIANSLKIDPNHIINGIANYDPESK